MKEYEEKNKIKKSTTLSKTWHNIIVITSQIIDRYLYLYYIYWKNTDITTKQAIGLQAH